MTKGPKKKIIYRRYKGYIVYHNVIPATGRDKPENAQVLTVPHDGGGADKFYSFFTIGTARRRYKHPKDVYAFIDKKVAREAKTKKVRTRR